MNVYLGTIPSPGDWRVHVIDAMTGTSKRLSPGYHHGVNHSPDGFAWGYPGSGPAQLAFAILANEFGPTLAKAHYQRFKQTVIGRLYMDAPFRLKFKKDIGEGLRSGAIEGLSMVHVEVSQ